MRDVINGVSAAEIRHLAELYGLKVSDGEATALATSVTDRLDDSLDRIYEIPVRDEPTDPGERRWREPTDEYNALSVECHVPPAPDHTGLLDGVSAGLKDIISVAGVPMQCASGVMHGHVPSGDATVAHRLRAAGATIDAKTNLDEFAGGGQGKSFLGLIRNPTDEDRIAGGSSGGSAAAVAANLVDVALGTDTGGSVRKPAAFCGLVGLKPTYGLVPLTGVIENTYTIDHVGPITKTVDDAARVLEAIAGKDRQDPASMAAAGEDDYSVGGYLEAVRSAPAIDDVRLGVATQGLTDNIDATVAERHRHALDALEDAGATLEDVTVPYLDETRILKNALSYIELASYWRDNGAPVRRGGVGNTLDQLAFARRARAANHELNDFYRSRLLTGALLMTAHHGRHYTRAQAARDTVRTALESELAPYDAIVTPTVPELAPSLESVRDPAFDYDGLDGAFGYGRYTKIANVTGVPAVTVPNESESGPAVGMQLLGSRYDEGGILGVARRIEETVVDQS